MKKLFIILMVSLSCTIATATFGQMYVDVYEPNDSLISSTESLNSLNYFITGDTEEGTLGESVVIVETDYEGIPIDTLYNTIVKKYSDDTVLRLTVIDENGVKFIMMFWKKEHTMISYTFNDRYVLIHGDINY